MGAGHGQAKNCPSARLDSLVRGMAPPGLRRPRTFWWPHGVVVSTEAVSLNPRALVAPAGARGIAAVAVRGAAARAQHGLLSARGSRGRPGEAHARARRGPATMGRRGACADAASVLFQVTTSRRSTTAPPRSASAGGAACSCATRASRCPPRPTSSTWTSRPTTACGTCPSGRWVSTPNVGPSRTKSDEAPPVNLGARCWLLFLVLLLLMTTALGCRHAGTPLQPHVTRHGRLQPDVLRPRLQHPEDDGPGAVRLQVPLVLLRRVQDVHADRRGAHVQMSAWPKIERVCSKLGGDDRINYCRRFVRYEMGRCCIALFRGEKMCVL